LSHEYAGISDKDLSDIRSITEVSEYNRTESLSDTKRTDVEKNWFDQTSAGKVSILIVQVEDYVYA
jgi:hypothetical protein